jgi:hypothetical protein
MRSLRGYWAVFLTFVAAVAAITVGVFAYTGMPEPGFGWANHAAHGLESRGSSGQTDNRDQGDPMGRQIAPSARQQGPPSPP